MMRVALVFVFSVAGVVGCTKDAPKPAVVTSVVPCLVAAGTALEGQPPSQNNVSGARWCAFALGEFFKRLPDSRIISIVPLEYPIADPVPSLREAGTQDLVIVHADVGPWPRAGNLAVISHSCGDRLQPCSKIIEQTLPMLEKMRFWLPLATFDQSSNQTATQVVLAVHER